MKLVGDEMAANGNAASESSSTSEIDVCDYEHFHTRSYICPGYAHLVLSR